MAGAYLSFLSMKHAYSPPGWDASQSQDLWKGKQLGGDTFATCKIYQGSLLKSLNKVGVGLPHK